MQCKSKLQRQAQNPPISPHWAMLFFWTLSRIMLSMHRTTNPKLMPPLPPRPPPYCLQVHMSCRTSVSYIDHTEFKASIILLVAIKLVSHQELLQKANSFKSCQVEWSFTWITSHKNHHCPAWSQTGDLWIKALTGSQMWWFGADCVHE